MQRMLAGILIVALVIPACAMTRDQALVELRSGNARYVAGQPHPWTANAEKREQIAKAGQPLACVITCSDAWVPPEILFDQSLGDIYVVRLAGNVVTPEAVGSVEYAVNHLKVPVVVVLGHTGCGMIADALTDGPVSPPVASVLARIKPSVESARQKGLAGDDVAASVVNDNARRGVLALLDNSRLIEDAVNSGNTTLLSAVYDGQTGRVNWQMQFSAPVAETAPVAIAPAEKTVEPKVVNKTPSSDLKNAVSTDANAELKPVHKKKSADPTLYTGRH
jgi:carbonic anhydrase